MTLLVPTLNEVVGIREIMPRVREEWVDQVLVVDGGASDGTAELCRAMGYDVHLQTRPGLRHAYSEAFQRVRGDIVITFSPDGNCIPELIPQLTERLQQGWDMVVCSRYAPGAHSEDDDAITAFGNWLFTRSINTLHRAHYTDSMGIYRAYWTWVYYALDLDQDEGYATERIARTHLGVEPLLSIRAAKAGLRITEIPGDEPPRVGGDRKLQILRWGVGYMAQVFREAYHWKPNRSEIARRQRESRSP